MKKQQGRGFFIFVGRNRKVPRSIPASFAYHKEEKDFSFYREENKNFNLQTEESDSLIKIYIGDRHFNSAKPGQNKTSEPYSCRETGVLITLDKTAGNICVFSDFMGTEAIFYTKLDSCIVLTDRIDNFSRFNISTLPDLPSVYSYLSSVFTVGKKTILKNVFQLRPLETLSIDANSNSISVSEDKLWYTEEGASPSSVYNEVDERMFEILKTAPKTNIMLSAGWDSRVLISSNTERIVSSYTHGDLSSREIKITFELGRQKNLQMHFSPLEATNFDICSIQGALAENGQIIFPHWYHAGKYVKNLNGMPLTAGLGVQLFSGHSGINSLSAGKDKLKKLASSMLNPREFDRMTDTEATRYLVPFLSAGFGERTWFFSNDVDGKLNKQEHRLSVEAILEHYINSGTTGAQELCERFKLEHEGRQLYSLQTKSAAYQVGYYHPYTDSKLNQILLKLKYRDRVNYKVSQYIVRKRDPSLLGHPLAATLVKASRPVIIQEASRVVRIATERLHKMRNRKIAKGLGWNNFQFLNECNYFHEYVDMLSNADYWDKDKMHDFVDDYISNGRDGYSLLEMLMKIVTVDYRLNPNHYD